MTVSEISWVAFTECRFWYILCASLVGVWIQQAEACFFPHNILSMCFPFKFQFIPLFHQFKNISSLFFNVSYHIAHPEYPFAQNIVVVVLFYTKGVILRMKVIQLCTGFCFSVVYLR